MIGDVTVVPIAAFSKASNCASASSDISNSSTGGCEGGILETEFVVGTADLAVWDDIFAGTTGAVTEEAYPVDIGRTEEYCKEEGYVTLPLVLLRAAVADTVEVGI